jgi:hypothetical protein
VFERVNVKRVSNLRLTLIDLDAKSDYCESESDDGGGSVVNDWVFDVRDLLGDCGVVGVFEWIVPDDIDRTPSALSGICSCL